MKKYVAMEYLYRDADNYKSFGKIILEGELTEERVQKFRVCLEQQEYFVAEQVKIPVLYSKLWSFSDGPTSSDHAFHELVGFYPVDEKDVSTYPL